MDGYYACSQDRTETKACDIAQYTSWAATTQFQYFAGSSTFGGAWGGE